MKGTVIYHAPVGDLQVDWEDGAITALKRAGADVKEAGAPNGLTEQVFRQLDEYFAGTRRRFDFPYRLHGTPFQEKVWAALRDIPYGETRSYKDIAEAIGHPKAFRAVGMANHANPICIAVPCHRVIGAGGALVGYGCWRWKRRTAGEKRPARPPVHRKFSLSAAFRMASWRESW